MKKGFTLIELLAVIVLLGLIFSITFPKVLELVEEKEIQIDEATKELIFNGTDQYMANDIDKYPNKIGNIYCFKINTLDKENLIAVSVDDYLNKYVKVKIGKKNSYSIVEKKACYNYIEYTDDVLNGTDPILNEGMLPVVIEDDGTVKYADTTEEWYNYTEKKWANAVITISREYSIGDTIPESDIESYFVWIPRFRYKLWNTDVNLWGTDAQIKGPHSIEIEFEPKDQTPSTGSNNGEWLTHPAFTSFNSNGFWVGKFETGYKDAINRDAALVNQYDVSSIIIKPNVYSWRGITVGNIFKNSYNYKRELDSHMMKNTEWGAVVYLSHSKYGIDNQINTNNNYQYKTGYSALPNTQNTYPGTVGDGNQNQTYNTTTGFLASTTGNISGIYDMSGGAMEYVSGYIDGHYGESDFDPSVYDLKYFDIYPEIIIEGGYDKRILGDATGEMGPFKDNLPEYPDTWLPNGNWYNDYSPYIFNSYPWFHRGGVYNYGLLTGQFNFSRHTGGSNNGLSYRIVLTPEKTL